MKKIYVIKTLLLLCALVAGSMSTWAVEEEKTSTLTFSSACGGSGTADDGAVWTVTSDAAETEFSEEFGIHYGSNKAAVSYIQLSTTKISGTITNVVVNARDAQGGATLTVTVGGESFGSTTIGKSAADHSLSGEGTGEIVVRVARNAAEAKALYVKSVVVTYTPFPPSPLTSLSVDLTNAKTNFYQDEPFITTGIEVIATYESGGTKDVTDDATFSTPYMSTPGTKTVTVSYTEEGVTKTTTYDITVIEYTQPENIVFNISQSLFPNAHISNNQCSDASMTATVEEVTMTIYKGDSPTYVADDDLRCYSGTTMKFEAPKGYHFTEIKFTKGSKWNMTSASNGSLSGQTWSPSNQGYTTEVTFSFGGRSNILSIEVSIEPTPVTVTVTAAEYATYCGGFALDFSGTDITVFTATDKGSYVKLNEITSGMVPANTPVVLYKAGGGSAEVPVIDEADPVGSNDLRISEGEAYSDAFVLAQVDGTVGFYLWDSSVVLNAGKVYLASTSGARGFLPFEDASAIDDVKAEATTDNICYDLQGRRVTKAQKGLYIVNGKKVLVK